MAAYAGTPVVIRSWLEPKVGPQDKQRTCQLIQIDVVAMGTVANPINASALGFAKIEEVTSAIDSGNTQMYCAQPNYAGTIVLLKKTDTFAPADATVTLRMIVKGWLNAADNS